MKFNPGETAPKTGTYNVVDSNGKVMNTAEVKKGQTLPHTEQQMALRNRLSSMKKRRFAVFFHYSPFIVAFFSV